MGLLSQAGEAGEARGAKKAGGAKAEEAGEVEEAEETIVDWNVTEISNCRLGCKTQQNPWKCWVSCVNPTDTNSGILVLSQCHSL